MDAYRRDSVSERVLQFGTGMLLRALVADALDIANRAGESGGRIVAVQGTPHGNADALNAQDGLFTLVERGLENGERIERTRLIGAISRALKADAGWDAVRDTAARPEIRVIVSNVTEAAFRIDSGFPARLTDVLYTRFERLPHGPGGPLFVIPTELVPDNGPTLAAMVDELAAQTARTADFRRWIKVNVRFCSSLVDRIVTGPPSADDRRALEAKLGYSDALITVAEPYAFWAIEGDPAELRSALPIEAPERVVFAPDIRFYRERKLRLLNATHTALAPLALLAGFRTVREAVEQPRFGAFLRRLLFDEIIPATDLPVEAATQFAQGVVERFHNPWLDHEWRVIATNQDTKMRIRVLPLLPAFEQRRGRAPETLARACAAYVAWRKQPLELDGKTGEAVRRWSAAIEQKGVEALLRD